MQRTRKPHNKSIPFFNLMRMEFLMSNLSGISQNPNSVRSSADSISSRHYIDRTRSRSWSRRSRLLLLLVVALGLVIFFTALLLGTQVYTLSRENQSLRANLARTEDNLHQVMPELKKLQADLDALVRGKLPRLRSLKYDEVLPLEEAYLKNVTFTEIVNHDSRAHEYKLVVQNNTRALLWPEIQLLVFNELGIQIGSSEIGTRDLNALKAGSLGVGEIRSYSAAIRLTDKNAMPIYFMIRVPKQVESVAEPLEVDADN